MNVSTWGPSTIIAAILTIAVAIAGGVIAALHPTTLGFTTYAEILAGFAGATASRPSATASSTPRPHQRRFPRPCPERPSPRRLRRRQMYTMSKAGEAFLAGWEGIVLHPYNDAVNNATIGIGHLIHYGTRHHRRPGTLRQVQRPPRPPPPARLRPRGRLHLPRRRPPRLRTGPRRLHPRQAHPEPGRRHARPDLQLRARAPREPLRRAPQRPPIYPGRRRNARLGPRRRPSPHRPAQPPPSRTRPLPTMTTVLRSAGSQPIPVGPFRHTLACQSSDCRRPGRRHRTCCLRGYIRRCRLSPSALVPGIHNVPLPLAAEIHRSQRPWACDLEAL